MELSVEKINVNMREILLSEISNDEKVNRLNALVERNLEIQNSSVAKEYELIYANKIRREEIISDSKIAPLQKIRNFNHSRGTQHDWENKLILGDNLSVMKSLLEDPTVKGKVNLVYIDPPFATRRDFLKDEEKAYADKVVGSEFIEFTRKRLILLKELMAPNATIFVHLDQKKGHYIKVILDEIFGEHRFLNEIIWSYGLGGSSPRYFPQKHDNIFWYSNGNEYYFDPPMVPATSMRMQGQNKKAPDVWDIPSLNNMAIERLQYPTQKPEALLERIIRSTTKDNDLVLDVFAGSGTTLAVAEKLGRRWIGVDCGKLSIYTIQDRLMNLKEEIGNKGKKHKTAPFSLFQAGLYDYKAFTKLPEIEYKNFVLKLFQAKPHNHEINGVKIDGYLNQFSVKVWEHTKNKDLVIDSDHIDSLHSALNGRGGSVFYLVAPVSVFKFPEDVKIIGDTEYRFLRVPQSVIDELIRTGGKTLKQPRSESDVNNTIDAIAFDFIRTPLVHRKLSKYKDASEDLFDSEKELGAITISEFKSGSMVEFENISDISTLAMLLVDNQFNGEVVHVSQVVFASEMKENTLKIDLTNISDNCLLIYIDIYGNEFREIVSRKDFK